MTEEIRADISDGRILLLSPPWCKDAAKAIPGHRARWDKTGDRDRFIGWTYPIAWSSCVALREAFGDDLKVGRDLTKWAWSEHRRREQLEDLRSGNVTELPRLAAEVPELLSLLENRPFQLTGTAFLTKARQACLGDEPRLGKTYQALATLVETGVQTILIACPKTATYAVWAKKIWELLDEQAYVAQEGRANRQQVMAQFASDSGRRILVVNKEMIRVLRKYQCQFSGDWQRFLPKDAALVNGKWESKIKPKSKHGCQGSHDHKNVYYPEYPELFDIQFDAVILDECHHALASEKNKQSDHITQIRLGAVRLNIAPNGLRLALSGTPFRATLTKSWGVLNWLRPDVFSSFWQYAETHFPVHKGKYGMEIDRTRLRDPKAFDEAMRPYYLARTVAQVAPQLPPVDYIDVILPMEGRQRANYDYMVKEAEADLEGGRITATGILAELTRRRQFATSLCKLGPSGKVVPSNKSNKLEWILQFLEEREAVGIKVVITSGFTEVVDLFTEELRRHGYSVVNITGDTSARDRQKAQDEFLNGPTQIAFINTFAGGEAIDLASANEMIFVDEPWTDDARQQAESRVRSLSKPDQVAIYRLRSEGTVEVWIAELNEEQRETLRAAKPQARQLMRKAA